MKKLILLLCSVLMVWLPVGAQAQNRPDLVVVAPYSLPTSVVVGGTYTMSATIRVNGNPGAGAQFNCIGYYLSSNTTWDANDAYLGASCQSLLMAGQQGTTSISATIPPLTTTGNYYLVLVADPLNAEQEQDETNNVVSFPVTVGQGTVPLPDLELWRPSLSFSSVAPGGNTGAFSFIFNRGAGSVSGYEIGFYLSTDSVFTAGADVFLSQFNGGSLAGATTGSTGTIFSAPQLLIPLNTVPGKYYLLLVIDPRNVIAETNEQNNSRALPLQVTGTVTATTSPTTAALEVYPNPVAAGQGVNIFFSGQPQPAQMTLYDALGRQVTSHSAMLSGQPLSLATSGLPAGIYTLRVLGPAGLHLTRRVVIE
ncbi:CARDB domain-containing protein [Hymenobacter cellulosilyticus]|uniref:T9SS type A sorting domain-containing protein n=1 Tax=Hymenobacter cellulosilyticus TaxID=2932248 RepID=A0A8T9Q690_9BACT|nr:CARDB domain-containing protein [Hymenobacter cellulosilyticus]UOQ72482.1 T9SS type A sorting domain-containing protein [Hymenobacter cellulosilyticus]